MSLTESQAITPELVREFRENGFVVLRPSWPEGFLEGLRLKARLPAWEDGERSLDDGLQRSGQFERDGAVLSGSALSRRAWMMNFGPRRHDDPNNWLCGRKGRRRLEGGLEPVETVLRNFVGGERVLAGCALERPYPGHTGENEGRASARGPGCVEAVLYLEDVQDEQAPLRVYPGSHTRWAERASAVAANDLYVEFLSGVPSRDLTGPSGTLILMDGALLRTETAFCDGPGRGGLRLRAAYSNGRAGGGEGASSPASPSPSSGSSILRRAIQFAKLRALFPLSRWWYSPLRAVNVGAGRGWQHPRVIALDVDPESDINLDVTHAGLPFADASLEIVYSSHCLEHLTPAGADFFFKEARRSLGSGGILRIVCPDMDAVFDAYDRRDLGVFDGRHQPGYCWDGLLRAAARLGVSTTVDLFTDEELAVLYDRGGRSSLLERLASEQERLLPQVLASFPDGHKSWWTKTKLVAALEREGFSRVYESQRDGSRADLLRDPRYFDYSSPGLSLYVEAVR